MSQPKNNHYVDGERMCELAAAAAKSGDISDELVEMFYLVARNRGQKFNPSLYNRRLGVLDTDDIVQEAVMMCVTKVKLFDAKRLSSAGDAFYFFRTLIDQCFVRLYEFQNRQMRSPDLQILSLDMCSDMPDKALSIPGPSELSDTVLDMRQQHDDGMTLQDLADEYGIDVEVVEELILRDPS